jgi:hypothetical protein
MVAMI